MNVLTLWFYAFPIMVTIVAALNRWTRWPHSWGLGALAQAGQIIVGIVDGKEHTGLVLSFLPLGLFTAAWITAVKSRRKEEVSA